MVFEAIWKSLVENAPCIIMIVDRKGEIKFINHTVSGITPEEAVGRKHYDYIMPEYHDMVREVTEKVFKTGEVGTYEIRGTGPDGSISWYETRIGPIKREGKIEDVVLITSDVTEKKTATDELRKLSYAIDKSPGIIMLTDTKGEIEYVNRRFTDVTGYSKEEIIGRSAGDIGEQTSAERDIMWKTINEGNEWQGLFKNKKKNGQIYWEKAAISPIKNEDGEITHFVKVAEDVTSQRESEQALVESEQKLRAIFNSAMDGILVADMDNTRFFDANKRMCEMLGYTLDELLRLEVKDIHPEEALPYVFRQFEKQAKGQITLAKNMPMMRKDGSVFQADVNSSPVAIAGRKYMLGVLRDITERKNAEEALRESEKKYRMLMEAANDAIFVADADTGEIVYVNRKAEELIGLPSDKIIGMHQYELHPREDAERYKAIFKEHLRKGGVIEEKDVYVSHRDGRKIPVEISAKVIDVGGTKLIHGIFRDSTERKKTEERLQQQKALLDKTNEELKWKVEELEAALSHIKTIEGLIPICVNCKKMHLKQKDPKDPKSWVSIEKYISDETKASLTHGLCPDCVKKMYGETLKGKGKDKQ